MVFRCFGSSRIGHSTRHFDLLMATAIAWEMRKFARVHEKSSGDYNAAVRHAAEAAELASNPEDRLWRRSYWAWYVMLRDGRAAGVTARL